MTKYYCLKCNHFTDRFGWSCKENFKGLKKLLQYIPMINCFFICGCWCNQFKTKDDFYGFDENDNPINSTTLQDEEK